MLAVHVEVTHTLAAQSPLQGLGNVTGAYAQQVGLLAVDRYSDLGFGELKVGIGHLEGGVLIYAGQECGQHILQFLYVGGLQNVTYRHAATTSCK